jgi:hypothetical protein
MSETVAEDLAVLPRLYDACEAVLGGRRRHFADDRVRGGLSRGLNLHEGALRARSRMLTVLASWSGLVASERGVSPPRRREVGVLAPFLLSHVDWLTGHPAAGDFACSRPVWATLRTGDPVSVRCEAGHDLPAHQWLLLGGVA